MSDDPDATPSEVIDARRSGEPRSAFPGWYPDPAGVAAERFWNGGRWTRQTKGSLPQRQRSPIPASVPAPPTRSLLEPDHERDTGNDIRFVDDTGDDIEIVEEVDPRPAVGSPLVTNTTVDDLEHDTDLARRSHSLFAPAAGSEPRRVTVPASDRRSDPPPRHEARVGRRRAWLAGVAAAVLGSAVGYGIGTSSSQVGSADAQIDLSASVLSAQARNETTRSGDVVQLQRNLDSLNIDLANANDELVLLRDEVEAANVDMEEAQDARDRLAEHNALLQSWFTTELRGQGQDDWDAEVDRACGLAAGSAAPTIDDLVYSQAMELIGTKSDLLLAVEACIDG